MTRGKVLLFCCSATPLATPPSQIPDGFSAVAVTADRNIDSDGPDAVESFTLYLTSDDSSEVRSQQFNLDGIAEQQSTTLSGVELANAELRLGVDLDDNEIIGAPDAIQLFDRYGTGNNNGSNTQALLDLHRSRACCVS